MKILQRSIQNELDEKIKKKKSILLFGARRTGKTTLLKKFADNNTKKFNCSYKNIFI